VQPAADALPASLPGVPDLERFAEAAASIPGMLGRESALALYEPPPTRVLLAEHAGVEEMSPC